MSDKKKVLVWICPKCDTINTGNCPTVPPGIPCVDCKYEYYIGKTLEEEIGAVSEDDLAFIHRLEPAAGEECNP